MVSDDGKGKGSAENLSLSEKKILSALSKFGGRASLGQISSASNFKNPAELMNALNWLKAKGYVWIDEKVVRFYTLKDRSAVSRPLPEREVLTAIAGGSAPLEDLAGMIGRDRISVAIGWLRKKGWARIDESKRVSITDKGKAALNIPGPDEEILRRLEREEVEETEENKDVLRELLSRRDFISEHERIVREVSLKEKGMEAIQAGLTFDEEISLLSGEILKSGRWREIRLRPYDIRAPVEVISGPRRHPLLRTIRQVSEVFAEMGFTEIEDEIIQSAFWDMDALFTPQDHPARDMQDTFYLSNPSAFRLEKRLVSKVRDAHENGGATGSTGWGYTWNQAEAERALLRTHTTVATIRYLAAHRKPPVKAFTVGRIFRHEAMDSTHLSEFHQIEGIIMEKSASFDMLCSVLAEFYRKMGFEKVRMRPGYFPYTEPSMEIDIHYGGKWIELGGSGMFRPEVLRPIGVRYPVLAWGLGLERLVMIRYGFKDIRDIYLSDVDNLRKMPLL
ncbi:MAG: phenylalanine--tRNA ligase subunit alpha [Candidatus Thermoplasmatota archaeon]|nr:phenylalanine--tRNA ligase subunit alpha [Candidatus Thermoplasmatota archaeon]